MQNKKLFKILAFVAIFILIIFTWVVVRDAQRKKILNNPVSTGIENPFGTSGAENDLNGSEEETNSFVPIEEVENPVDAPTTTVIIEDNPSLRNLSPNPVAGFTFIEETREIPDNTSTTPNANIVEVFDFSGYKTIKFGDKTEEIIPIKTVLNRQNPTPALVINNDYDTDMKNAVVDFQNRNGLTGDGVIGTKTYSKLNSFQGITSFTSTKPKALTEKVLIARYVDSATGFVYDQAVKKQEVAIKRTSNVVPGVVEAFFDDTATRVVMRFLKDDKIETYLARLTFPKIDPNLTQTEKDALPKTANVTGEYLPQNINTLSVSNDGKSMFYLSPSFGGVNGFVYNFANKTKKQIFSSSLTEWIADFANPGKVNLTTKATSILPGYSYSIGNPSGNMTRNLGGDNGLLTLMSPDGKKILFSNTSGGNITTFVKDLSTGKETSISPTTLPEKCVWTKDSRKIYCAAPARSVSGNLPDDWYKGKVSFDDVLWVVDMRDMSGNILYDFVSKNNKRIDAINLRLNQKEDYIGFVNKKDGAFWGFDLSR
jgi:Tol biopolymer transport system component